MQRCYMALLRESKTASHLKLTSIKELVYDKKFALLLRKWNDSYCKCIIYYSIAFD
jgi:hypothetical protein